MEVRKIALVLPLALGIAACRHTSSQSAKTAQGAETGTAAAAQGAYGTGAASTPSGNTGILTGRAADVSPSSLSIQTDAGTRETLSVVPETIITIDGREGHLSDITQGQDVRASYNDVQGKKVAVKLEANRTGSSSMGGSSSGMGSSPSGTAPGSSSTGTPSSDTSSGTPTGPDTSSGTPTGPDTSGTGTMNPPSTGR
jgi:hypothetical protein